MKPAFAFVMGATLLCTACRKESAIYYKVHNMSLAPITIKCELRGEPGIKEWYIPENSQVTIAKNIPGKKNVYNYKESKVFVLRNTLLLMRLVVVWQLETLKN